MDNMKCIVCTKKTDIYQNDYKNDVICSFQCYIKHNAIDKPKEPITLDLNKEVNENTRQLKIIYTNYIQLGLISLEPGGIIPKEIHQSDQMIYILKGKARINIYDIEGNYITDTKEISSYNDDNMDNMIIIPAYTQHQLENITDDDHEDGDYTMKAFTSYAPKAH